MAHGLMASAGLNLMTFAVFAESVPAFALYALILLAISAGGGLVLNLGYQWRNLPIPIGLMVLHALLAVAGFVLLLIVVCGSIAPPP